MKDEGPNVFKLVKTNSALDFVKNNTSLASTSEVLSLIKSKVSCFNYYINRRCEWTLRLRWFVKRGAVDAM